MYSQDGMYTQVEGEQEIKFMEKVQICEKTIRKAWEHTYTKVE